MFIKLSEHGALLKLWNNFSDSQQLFTCLFSLTVFISMKIYTSWRNMSQRKCSPQNQQKSASGFFPVHPWLGIHFKKPITFDILQKIKGSKQIPKHYTYSYWRMFCLPCAQLTFETSLYSQQAPLLKILFDPVGFCTKSAWVTSRWGIEQQCISYASSR